MTNGDIIRHASRWSMTDIVAGIDNVVRDDNRPAQAAQFMDDIRAVRLLANLLRVADTEGVQIGSILEVGCAVGNITRYLMGITRDIVAFDASAEAIARAKAQLPFPDAFCVGDGLYPEAVTDRTFDLVLFSEFLPLKRNVLGDAPPAEYDAYYNELIGKYLARLNSGGMLFVFHGINHANHHIKPRRLALPATAVEVSPRIAAIHSLFRHPGLSRIVDRIMMAGLRRRVTCFYMINRTQ